MMRSMPRLPFAFSILFLSACPPDDIIFPEDTGDTGSESSSGGFSSSSGGVDGSTTTPAATTGDDTDAGTAGLSGGIGFDCLTIPQVASTRDGLATHCDQHPWTDASPSSLVSCQDVVLAMLATPACEALDWCDYIDCAKAMANAPCGEPPKACAELVACLGV
jgi:hypothetical protein